MLSPKERLGTPGEVTLPVHAVAVGGKTIAVVREAALATLPFAPAATTTTALHSAEEATAALETCSEVPREAFALCARVTFSLSPAAQQHALLIRNVATSASFSQLLDATPQSLEAALSKAAGLQSLWQAAPSASSATSSTNLQVHLMSVPAVPPTISTSLNDLPLAAGPHEDSGITTRLVLGSSVTDITASLKSMFEALLAGDGTALCGTEVCWPAELPFPVNVHSRDDARRKTEHAALLLPNKALLHHRHAIDGWATLEELQLRRPSPAEASFRLGEAWERHLVTNPHAELQPGAAPSLPGAETLLTSGSYDYYHYRVDGHRDDGWGCAYRSLQTVLSWFQHAGHVTAPIPSIQRIQEILYATDPDKATKKKFVGSCDWIGSFEVMLVLQHYMPELNCTIKRLESGKDLDNDPQVQMLLSEHFRQPHASPVMIGGSSYAHTILGIHVNVNTMEARYLVLDPHYSANPTQIKTAIKKGYVGWKEAAKFFEAGSWYNLCIPRTDLYDPR